MAARLTQIQHQDDKVERISAAERNLKAIKSHRDKFKKKIIRRDSRTLVEVLIKE